MLRFIFKEASLLVAFVILGALLLLCVWFTHNVETSILKEFKHSQISLILKDGTEQIFKPVVEHNDNVIRYEIFGPIQNKERLGALYPELKTILNPLDKEYFPTSAIVTVRDAKKFLSSLEYNKDLLESQVLHEPPTQLRRFLSILTFVFSALWLLTLTLVLYFNLERLTLSEQPRWSLMKMLGAKPKVLFMPLWYGQVVRITIASLSAIALATLVSKQIQGFFIWNWTTLPALAWTSFFLIAVGMTTLISFALFFSKYRRIAIG